MKIQLQQLTGKCKKYWRCVCDNYTWFSMTAMNGKRGEAQFYQNKRRREQQNTRD